MTHVIRWNYGDLIWPGDGKVHPTVPFRFDTERVRSPKLVQKYALALVQWASYQSRVFQGPYMADWGSDFSFGNASQWFGQMDQVLEEINGHPERYNGTSVRYGSLSEYFDYLHTKNLSFPVFRGQDFEFGWPRTFPIALTGNRSVQYQNGGTASRHRHKGNIRRASRLTHATEAAHAVALALKYLSNSSAAQFMPAWDANVPHNRTPHIARLILALHQPVTHICLWPPHIQGS